MNIKNISERDLSFILIGIAFVFSVCIRLIWVFVFSDTETFKFNGQFILTNADGFYFANNAKEVLEYGSAKESLLLSNIIVFFVKITPFSIESVIFYISIFLSSLIVIPLYLLGNFLYDKRVGFVSALIGSIAVSYYNRTMVGYLDTDMLNLVLPMLLLYFLIVGLHTHKAIFFVLSGLSIMIYKEWYTSSIVLSLVFISMVVFYMLFAFFRQRDNVASMYALKLVVIMMISNTHLDFLYKLLIVSGLYFVFINQKYDRYIWVVVIVSLVLAYLNGFFEVFIAQLNKYVFKSSNEASSATNAMQLQFYNVINTVKETQAIPFETFAIRVSGGLYLFIASIIGFGLLVAKKPIFLLSLPLVGFGLVAYGIPPFVPSAGLRFTIYLVPVMALTLAYFIVFIADKVSFEQSKISMPTIIFFTLLALLPNIEHIRNYRVPTVLNNYEAEMLSKLKSLVKREDVVISWWDFGYPISYYTGARTLIDGGRNLGASNFYVSYMLTNPQKQSAKMARMHVEFLDVNKTEQTNIEFMSKAYNVDNPNQFLDYLSKDNLDIELPPKTKEIYFYLPSKIIDLYPVIESFSNIDLLTGKPKYQNTFFKAQVQGEDKYRLYFMNGVTFIKNENKLTVADQDISLNSLYIRQLTKDQKIVVNNMVHDTGSNINLLLNLSEKSVTVSTTDVFDSLYFQLFLLGNYDKDLFEYVYGNYFGAIYKLKI